jgi:hypothetical protein
MPKEPEKNRQSTDDGKREIELVVGDGLPAIFVNRFYVTSNPSFTRIIFAERAEDNRDLSRVIVVLPTSDARELGELLQRVIRELTGGHGSSIKPNA